MFGYVRPSLARLTEEERRQYNALYCGLCHLLGQRYGPACRMILNFDFTFLAALLSGPVSCRKKRCISSPLRGKPAAEPNGALETAADCSVLLTYYKLLDEVGDSSFPKRQGCRSAAAALRPAFRKAAALRPELDRHIRRQLQDLGELERQRCPELDRPADAFACLLQGIAEEAGDPVQRRVLSHLLYHLGRWIYLVDALDDRKKDTKTGNYNPILLRFSLKDGTLTEEARRRVVASLDGSIRQMAAAFELWDFGMWNPVIQATVYEGLYCVGSAVLEGTFHAGSRRKPSSGKKEQI